jgi:Mannosyl-glycoprotein endo-beta-N-acetylglucosaminidase
MITRRTELSPLKATLTPAEITALRAWAQKQTKAPGVGISPALTVDRHIKWAGAVGLDPALTIAQSIKETGWFKSWWYQEPRRNPAGIGVSGAWLPGPTNPDPTRWVTSRPGDPRGQGFTKGLTYTSYAAGTLTQIYRLTQWASLTFEPLAAKWASTGTLTPNKQAPTSAAKAASGTATTINQLGRHHNPNHIGWADPGDTYGHDIARIANTILGLK